MFGVFRHHVMNRKIPMVRGFDDYFYAPHSRHTEIREEDILKHEELTILAKSKEAGVFLVINQDGSQIFVMGHPEYDRMTLDSEYKRDRRRDLRSRFRVIIIRMMIQRSGRCCSGGHMEISFMQTG